MPDLGGLQCIRAIGSSYNSLKVLVHVSERKGNGIAYYRHSLSHITCGLFTDNTQKGDNKSKWQILNKKGLIPTPLLLHYNLKLSRKYWRWLKTRQPYFCKIKPYYSHNPLCYLYICKEAYTPIKQGRWCKQNLRVI